jgi:uncharacterized protein (UPF0332 family)
LTPEQTALIRKAEASLPAAQLLAEQRFYDFAVSRAYYTMFYVASAFLLSRKLSFSSHAGVIAAFGQQLARTGAVPVEFHRYLIENHQQDGKRHKIRAISSTSCYNTTDPQLY